MSFPHLKRVDFAFERWFKGLGKRPDCFVPTSEGRFATLRDLSQLDIIRDALITISTGEPI